MHWKDAIPAGIHTVIGMFLHHFFQVPFLVHVADNLDSLPRDPEIRFHHKLLWGGRPYIIIPFLPRHCVPRATQYRACGSEMAALHKSPIVQLLWKDGAPPAIFKGELCMAPYSGNQHGTIWNQSDEGETISGAGGWCSGGLGCLMVLEIPHVFVFWEALSCPTAYSVRHCPTKSGFAGTLSEKVLLHVKLMK